MASSKMLSAAGGAEKHPLWVAPDSVPPRFSLEKLIGSGGFGRVFEGKLDGNKVAIKSVSLGPSRPSPELLALLLREVHLMAAAGKHAAGAAVSMKGFTILQNPDDGQYYGLMFMSLYEGDLSSEAITGLNTKAKLGILLQVGDSGCHCAERSQLEFWLLGVYAPLLH